MLAALIEAAPYSWSAIYLADDTGASPGTAGLGFTAFTTAMVLGRLVADKVVDKVGPVAVVRVGGLAAGLALAVALAVGGTTADIVAFTVMGLGSAFGQRSIVWQQATWSALSPRSESAIEISSRTRGSAKR